MGIPEMLFLVESLTKRPANVVEREIVSAISSVVDEANPIFGDVETDEVVLLETAWRESGFDLLAAGDEGRSHGAYQLQRVAHGLSAREQTKIAYARLRDSARQCGAGTPWALAGYLSGSCTNRGGRKLSAFRLAEAARLRRMVDQSGVAEAQ